LVEVRLPAAVVVMIAVLGVSTAGARRPAVPAFRHVLVVVFENKERSEVAGSPTFAALARRYASLTGYDAVAHPSLPNYLALVSGSTQGITSDCTTCVVDAPSLADTLTAAHRTWKAYAEGLPSPGWTGAYSGRYAKKHDPFLYFRSVLRNRAQRRRVVPYTRLAADVASNRLPDFALVVPDLCNGMHDCSVATGDTWLRTRIVPLLAKPALRRSVVFVVFDEGRTAVGGSGNVAALVLGPLVRPGSVSARPTGHYSLLRTIEDAWRLPRLGLSARARPIAGIWK
jgi:phosphatidylinositol-3-phosphatase